MAKIKRTYFISHTHTDFAYTDHQDSVFRQDLGFISWIQDIIANIQNSVYGNKEVAHARHYALCR